MTSPVPETASPTGCCSLGCASVFVFAALVWPLLHVIGRTYEPEVLFFPLMIGAPAFFIGNGLALFAMSSADPRARRGGKWALGLMWGAVTLFFLVGFAAYLTEKSKEP